MTGQETPNKTDSKGDSTHGLIFLQITSGQIDATRDANASGNPKAGTSRDLPETPDAGGGVSDEMIEYWIERSELFGD